MLTSIKTTNKQITKALFGSLNGHPVYLYTLTNKNGHELKITNYGATLTSWESVDKTGKRSNCVVGFDSLQAYLNAKEYHFGGVIGRFANRIAGGKFKLEDKEYHLSQNEKENHLHGGHQGFDRVVWNAKAHQSEEAVLSMQYTSPDGEEGYPGRLQVKVRFTFSDDNTLSIEYFAHSNKLTVINLTNHTYFNLSGSVQHSILNHTLKICSAYYLPTTQAGIPTGSIATVKQTCLDFTKNLRRIGDSIHQTPPGYDHCFLLKKNTAEIPLAAILKDPMSGRTLEVYTTEPGLQFYTGNFLDGKITSREGIPIGQHSALCLETQHFPDSPNQETFPTTVLNPHELFYSVTKYKLFL